MADADVDDAGAVEADELGHELFGRGDAEGAGLRLGGVVGGLLRVVGRGCVEGARRVEGLRSRGGGLRRMDVVGGRLCVVGCGRVESARGVGCGLRRVDVVGGLLCVVNGGRIERTRGGGVDVAPAEQVPAKGGIEADGDVNEQAEADDEEQAVERFGVLVDEALEEGRHSGRGNEERWMVSF